MNIVMDEAAIVIALLIFVAPALADELPLNPAVTQATIGGTICKPGWTQAVRPPLRVTDQIKRDKLRAAGWTDADKNRFELDYIIPLSLGGAPDDPKNFQLEPGNEVVEREALEMRTGWPRSSARCCRCAYGRNGSDVLVGLGVADGPAR
jgi:hypothetical protein